MPLLRCGICSRLHHVPFPLTVWARIQICHGNSPLQRKCWGRGDPLKESCAPSVLPADRLHARLYSGVAHGFFRNLDDMHHWLDFLAHVIVLVFDFHGAAAGIFHVCLARKMFDLTFAAFEARAVVIAYDICEGCLFYGSFNPTR